MIQLTGHVDEQHRLSADVPSSVQPGKVRLLLMTPNDEDEAGLAWADGIAREWAAELSDPREDVYSLSDGRPLDARG